MNIATIHQQPTPQPPKPEFEHPVIDASAIKAILYLGIRGDIALPEERHQVDILA